MIYIDRIKIKSTDTPGSEKLKKINFKCSDINIIVGENGIGKSTLLRMINDNSEEIEFTSNINNIPNDGVNTFYFDFENDNPRIKDPESFTKPSGDDVGLGYIGAAMTRFQSHGEILKKYAIDYIKEAKNSIIYFDEPEAGLSLSNLYRFINTINMLVEDNKCQLFIVTHNPIIIENYNVICLDDNRVIKGKTYLKKIKNKVNDEKIV